VVQIGNRQIALIRDGNTIRGISGRCPHYAGPLAQGQVRHGEIVCPWHRFRFDLATGRSKTNPALRAPVYEVRVAGDEVIVAGVLVDPEHTALETSQA
jgi:nitrite reductase/ring-hydroxylating ferredoxin subunit